MAFFILINYFSTPILSQVPTGNISEQFPQTRDPRYIPPLIPNELRDSVSSNNALLLFSTESDGLAEYIQNQKKEEIENRRTNNRYLERETERMLEWGLHKKLLEREIVDQLGDSGFEDNAGRYAYKESKARRFSIIFLLSFPFTAGFGFGVIRLGKLSNGDNGGFTNNESILGGILAVSLAIGIAIYDQHRVADLLEPKNRPKTWPEELEKRDGLHPDDWYSRVVPNQLDQVANTNTNMSRMKSKSGLAYQKIVQFQAHF